MRPLFASVENVLVELIFPLIKRKQPRRFTRVCQFASNKSWWVNLQVQLLVASKYRLRPNGSKNNKFSSRLTAVILKDFCLEVIERRKYYLIFVTAEEVLSKPFLFFSRKKNCLTVSLINTTCVCSCRKAVLPVCKFNPYLLVICLL